MKHKFSYLLGAIIFSLSIGSCGTSSPTVEDEVERVTLQVNTPCGLAVDDSFFDCASVTIRGHYPNGDVYEFNPVQATFFLSRYGVTKDINQPFEQTGEYSLRVKVLNLYSNPVSFRVNETHKYIDKFDMIGPKTLCIGQQIEVHLDTGPYHNFNGTVERQNSNSNVIWTTVLDNTSFMITGLHPGTSTVTYKVKKNENQYVDVPITYTVNDLQKTEIEQTYYDLDEDYHDWSGATPPTGLVKLLVVPIWFTNTSSSKIEYSKRNNVLEDLQTCLFGSPETIGWHSLSSFYYEESKGALALTGTIADWYETSNPVEDYDETNESSNSFSLIREAVEYYFNNHPEESRKDYDSDHDGYLDGVIGVPAHPYIRAFAGVGGAEGANVSKPSANYMQWTNYSYMYDAASSTYGEERTGYRYSQGDCKFRKIDSTTFCHEMAHMLNAPDLYDELDRANYTGGYNMQTDVKCGHDPFIVMAYGWADPYIPTNSCTITINDFQSSHELILLTPQWNSYNSAFDEYMLVELYSPTGLNYYDAVLRKDAPNMVGIRLWHVDAILIQPNGGAHFTSNVYEYDPVYHLDPYPAFKNHPSGSTGTYMIDRYWKNYALLKLIRNDDQSLLANTSITNSALFHVGDTFTFDDFKSQFPRYDNDGDLIMDMGQELGWEFTIDAIYDNHNDTYSASISLTKTA